MAHGSIASSGIADYEAAAKLVEAPLPIAAAAVIASGDANPVNQVLGLTGDVVAIPPDATRVGRIDITALGVPNEAALTALYRRRVMI